MRGSPLMRALGVLCVLLALGWGLRAVTHPHGGEGSAPNNPTQSDTENFGQSTLTRSAGESAPPQNIPVSVQVTFSAPARKAELRHLGKVVWSADAPPAMQKLALQIPFPSEGIELAVRVEWAGGGWNAMRVQLTTPDGTELDRTAWGEAVLETILPFP